MSDLTSERVERVFMDCLFRDGEDTSEHVKAEGIVRSVGFHPERLESHRPEIETMLAALPDQFQQSSGGGWSFLNACMDRDGQQWTGLHLHMEQLFQLGIGIGRAKWQLPREMWSALPGGMPYVVVLDGMACEACGAETTRRLCARCDPDAPCGECGSRECRCGPEVDELDEAAHRRGHGFDVPMGE